MDESRWTLTVEFDSIAEIEESGSDSLADHPLGEDADFYAWLREYWNFDEDDEDIEWEGKTVTATGDTLDYFIMPMQSLMSRYIPKSVTLKRNDPR